MFLPPPTFVTKFSSIPESLNMKLTATSRSFSHVCSIILLIIDKYGFKVLYLELVSLKGHILTTETIMFKLSSMFENSVTEVDEAETLKFLSILTDLRSCRLGDDTRSARELHALADYPLASLPQLPAYKHTILNAYKCTTFWKLPIGLNNVVVHPVNKVGNKFVNKVRCSSIIMTSLQPCLTINTVTTC